MKEYQGSNPVNQIPNMQNYQSYYNIPNIGQPILNSNMMPIGGYNQQPQMYGVMNGYYNPNGYNFYNPYLIKQQQEAQEAAKRQYMKAQSESRKQFARIANKTTKRFETEEELEEYLKIFDYVEPVRDEEYYKKEQQMKVSTTQWISVQELQNPFVNYVNNERSRMQTIMPEDVSLAQFLDNFGDVYMDYHNQELAKEKRNLSKTYDRDSYKELLSLHTGKHIPNTTKFRSLDDIEVSIPDQFKDEFARKREQFFESIFANNRKVGGI